MDAPEKIYIFPDSKPKQRWTEDSYSRCDVEYIRADLLEKLYDEHEKIKRGMIKSYEDNLVLDEECTGLKHENAELKEGLRLIERLVREKVGIPETKPLQETYSERARFTSELINDHLVKSQLQQRVPDGLEQAAQWVEQRLENYVEEHGYREQDTNAVVFPGDGADYVCELDEIAEGIRSLKESATQPPEPGQSINEIKAEAVRNAAEYLRSKTVLETMASPVNWCAEILGHYADTLAPQEQRESE